jgi:hypothetical protein
MGYVVISGVLKQVWDLSDEDNDSMLSLREFCTALYFMERFREGRALPSTLPAGIHPDGSQVSAVAVPQGPGGQSAAVWRHIPGLESGELFHESVFELNCFGDRGGWDVGVDMYARMLCSDGVVGGRNQVLHKRRVLLRRAARGQQLKPSRPRRCCRCPREPCQLQAKAVPRRQRRSLTSRKFQVWMRIR